MSTNYYAHINICPHCNRPEFILHIGKYSGGWSFTFRGYEEHIKEYDGCKFSEIKSEKDWRKLLSKEKTVILDEYDNRIEKGDFWALVEEAKTSEYNHAKMILESHPMMGNNSEEYKERNWIDEEGNSFTDIEFC